MRQKAEIPEAQYAAWIRRPDDPVSAWGWICNADRRFKPGQRKRFVAALILIVALSLFLGSGGILLIGIVACASATFFFRPQAQEHAALPTVANSLVFPVSLTLSKGGRRTGEDLGWVSFVDGWLFYEGLRTSFSVNSNCPSSIDHNAITVTLPDGRRVCLTRHLGQTVTATTALISRTPYGQLRDALEDWKRGPIPHGNPVLPPLRIHPNATAQHLKSHLMWAGLLFVGVLACAVTDFWIPAIALLIASIVYDVRFFAGMRRFKAEFQESFNRPGIEARG